MTWDDLELLRCIADAGTLTQAGRILGVDQTTAARRLARVERQLGVTLFDRIDGRLVATPALAAAREHLAVMADAARQSEAALRQTKAELDGRVRISSTGFVLAHLLAPDLAAFHAAHPRIVLDLSAETRNVSFERREADISIRMARPAEGEALARWLGLLRLRLYRAGDGEGAAPLMRYEEDLAHVPEMRVLDRIRPQAQVVARAGHLDILAEAAVALGAEVMLPEALGDADPRFRRVDDPAAVADRELFMMIHPDRRRSVSVSAVVAWIETVCRARLIRSGAA
ncbi:LysR family transcriptional regulator [Phreatobacter sp. AB_2022a]|uniref:LysR family transcriptional regulator n=1 Tax=Phreatobacter sp. AB_2022a TaxID=3003134 RepID=UPI002286EEBA|nr:LysR family transcriptional regulator [Phreatobacter sp. AB_2022a]MCZ0736220.1 LysR family transcriptional regulator [Phreatobacter sp. AB_2022a]